jgi:hypothetical protein
MSYVTDIVKKRVDKVNTALQYKSASLVIIQKHITDWNEDQRRVNEEIRSLLSELDSLNKFLESEK